MTVGGNRLVWLGSLVLAATAAFHGSGYRDVTEAVAASTLEGMVSEAIGGLWPYPTVHWLFLAVLAIVVASLASSGAPLVLRLIAAVLLIDVIILLAYVGPFIGEAMLAASAAAYTVATLRRGTA